MTELEAMQEAIEKYAKVWRLHYEQRDRGDGIKEWHAVCLTCGTSVAQISRGRVGYTWAPGELLALTAAHIKQAHEGVMGQ